MSVSNNFKNNDKVLAIWPGYTDRKFGSYWWRGTLIKRNGVNQFIISFDGQECAVSEQFVKADGVVHAATEEETRLFCLLHSPESKYFKKDKYDLATVNEEMRNVSNGKFLFKFEKKNWGIFNWSNIKKYANGQYLIVVGWDEISYYEEVGKNKIRILHAISIDFASSFEPIFYDSSEPNIAYLFDSNTMFKILPVICELYTINQHFFQDEPSSYNVID